MNLVIGATSQLAKYFPDDFVKVSSRHLDLDYLSSRRWESVFVCFAEQRTYLANSSDETVAQMFSTINTNLTKEVIQKLQPVSDHIFYYSTAELWNRCSGAVDLSIPFSFHSNLYTSSKHTTTVELQDKNRYPKVSILYPFNFNSVHRGENYLFGKVFRSIIREEKISLGDLNYYRELLHPSMVVDATLKHVGRVGEDLMVGSGRLIHVGDFIRGLYEFFCMCFDDMVECHDSPSSLYRTHPFYSSVHAPLYGQEQLFRSLTQEILKAKDDLVCL